MTPEQLINSGGLEFGMVAPVFHEPKGGSGKTPKEVILLNCVSCRSQVGLQDPGNHFSLEQVLTWMRQKHYRPGTAHELLAFAASPEKPNRVGLLIALGSKATDWHNKDPRFVGVSSKTIFLEDGQTFGGGTWFIAFDDLPTKTAIDTLPYMQR